MAASDSSKLGCRAGSPPIYFQMSRNRLTPLGSASTSARAGAGESAGTNDNKSSRLRWIRNQSRQYSMKYRLGLLPAKFPIAKWPLGARASYSTDNSVEKLRVFR